MSLLHRCDITTLLLLQRLFKKAYHLLKDIGAPSRKSVTEGFLFIDSENADKLAKEARYLNNDNFVNVTLLDANDITNFKLREKSIPVKHQICHISEGRLIYITKTFTRLRTGHLRVMQFDRDGIRTYRNCDNCLDIELTPAHIFDCPAILAAFQEIGILLSSTNLYVDNIKQIARTGPKLRVLVAALWDKKLAFRTRDRRKFWIFTDGPQRREKKRSSEAVLRFNSASEKKSVLLKEDQTDL
ncbi:uncharacterized protein TNCV_3493761 [Trichonephila clavipes]|nr:uncharacterized protein TNCV_3493761 [Trichonephila clavipes]